jgi:hypothetical protein
MADDYKVSLYRKSRVTGGSALGPAYFDVTIRAISVEDAARQAKALNPGCEVRGMPQVQSTTGVCDYKVHMYPDSLGTSLFSKGPIEVVVRAKSSEDATRQANAQNPGYHTTATPVKK